MIFIVTKIKMEIQIQHSFFARTSERPCFFPHSGGCAVTLRGAVEGRGVTAESCECERDGDRCSRSLFLRLCVAFCFSPGFECFAFEKLRRRLTCSRRTPASRVLRRDTCSFAVSLCTSAILACRRSNVPWACAVASKT